MAASALSIFTLKPDATKISISKPLVNCKSSPSSSSIPVSSPQKLNKKKPLFEVGIGLLAASLLVLSPLNANATRQNYYATVAEPSCDLKFVPSGLGYCDLAVGSGPEAPFNELINVHYTGRFADGTVFGSSYQFARPLTMRIGVGKVIKGLDQGILGGEGVPPMLVGGKRKLQIPPELAYGPEPAGCFSGDCNIPANATLVYNVAFVDIYKGNRK